LNYQKYQKKLKQPKSVSICSLFKNVLQVLQHMRAAYTLVLLYAPGFPPTWLAGWQTRQDIDFKGYSKILP
jgi:hypothetical protein